MTSTGADKSGGRSPLRTRLLVVGSAVVLISVGVWFAQDRKSGLRECGSQGPSGSTPCLYRCTHSRGLDFGTNRKPPEDRADCLYDPTGKIFATSTTGPLPETPQTTTSTTTRP